MATTAVQLIDLARSVEPPDGFGGYFDLVDALEANVAAMTQFKKILATSKAEDLDAIDEISPEYGWIVMGAADAMDLLPDDPRLFLSEADAAALPADKVLGALCSACIVNDKQTVARLVRQIDVNSLDHHSQTPLCYAVGNNHADCVRILIDHGANPNRVQNWGNTALHIAASSICSKETFAMLLAADGDVNAVNEAGESVLQVLAKFGRESWMELRDDSES